MKHEYKKRIVDAIQKEELEFVSLHSYNGSGQTTLLGVFLATDGYILRKDITGRDGNIQRTLWVKYPIPVVELIEKIIALRADYQIGHFITK